ncbi:hypothetical protein evm_002873 [Chilo suppressalis]|nr:hypothetical protein evm_002873 [Chilo suppressalis]
MIAQDVGVLSLTLGGGRQKVRQLLETEIERLTLETIASITSDDWKKEINHVKRLENVYYPKEILEEDDYFRFIINTAESIADDGYDYSGGYAELSGIEELDSD